MNTKTIESRSGYSIFQSYQDIFLKILSQMKIGRLELSLPSGETLTFGSIDSVPVEFVARIQVRSPLFFKRCILFGDIGFGESYTAKDWDTDSITNVIQWMILNWEDNPSISGSRGSRFGVGILKAVNRCRHLLRDNDQMGSIKNIAAHYDLGNELFETFLDSSMTYSCADFSQGAKTLEEAQIAKLDRLAQSIQIKPGEHVLEIGGGWGAFAVHLAKKYGARVTTITVSKEQLQKIKERIAREELTDKVDAHFLDYRQIHGHFNKQFDKIVSVEMLEAVGHRHFPSFFESVEQVLKPKGLMGVQVITSADSRYDQVRRGVDWIQKHIFPGSLIPSVGALNDAARAKSRLQVFSLHDMGSDYAHTLSIWRERFNSNLSRIKKLGFDEPFIRAWNYYFSYCEAAFVERHISAVQIVYTRPNNSSINTNRMENYT